MKSSHLLAAAVLATVSQLSLAQKQPAATLPAATASQVGQVAANTGALQLRALPAVLDARERRQDWHLAAQQAGEAISNPALRDQFNKRLAGLVPIVAKALIAQPQEDALVTVAVYRDPAKPNEQAMVTVTFNGLGGQIGEAFFADVLAGMPKAPEAEGIPKSLTLDTQATNYLVFFMGKAQLQAGAIPNTVMGRSVVAVINRERNAAQSGNGAVAVAPAGVAPVAPVQPQAQQPDVAHPEVGDVQPLNGYVNPAAYPAVNDGYYYPSTVGVPIVILPGEYPSSPTYLDAQRRRQAELERRYQQNINTPNGNHSVTAQSGNSNTPQSPNYVTPQSGNSVTPQSGNGVTAQSGNSVTPQSANNVSPQQTKPNPPVQFPKAGEPGGPPANKDAPQQPAKGTPPAGAPGGPPAQPPKK